MAAEILKGLIEMTTAITIHEEGTVQPAEITFEMIVEEWLQFLSKKSAKRKKAAKPRTIENYRYALKVFQSWLDCEHVEFQQATEETITAWTEAMDSAKNLKGRPWSASTKNLYLTAVRNFYKWASATFGVTNIAAGFGGWECSKEHKRGTLSVDEMKELLEVVAPVTEKKITDAKEKLEGLKIKAEKVGRTFNYEARFKRYKKNAYLQCKRDKAILSALMAGGLRTIEIVRLRVGDLKRMGGIWFLNVLGKGRDEREGVKISHKAARVIRDWLDAREAVDVVKNDSPLFCSVSNNSFGDDLTSLSVSRLVKEYLRAAGLKEKEYKSESGEVDEVKPIVAHSLRGSLATQAFLRGATLDQVKQQLRHRNVATSMIYLEEAKKSLNPCSDLISEAIF